MSTSFDFPRGSEWRKWDLHVHSPNSVLEQSFGEGTPEQKWASYIAALAALPDTAVVGVTDYFLIDGYYKVQEALSRREFPNVEFVLPNIEFRALPATTDGHSLNVHALLDPAIVDEVETRLLHKLIYTYAGDRFRCTRDDLIKLGRSFLSNDSLDESPALREGMNQFKIGTVEELRGIVDGDKILRGHVLLAVSQHSADGASGIDHSALAATREGIYRAVDCVFTANPKDRAYFLGQGTDTEDTIRRKYGGPKPCIWGSDAHDLARIGKPDRDRFCWVKADPTFEGLKQIVYEPDDRVFVGSPSPVKSDRRKVIRTLAVRQSNGWFEELAPIELNDNLVTVIGGKGTGKTALLDLLAYATGCYDAGDDRSFLKKACGELDGATVQITWADAPAQPPPLALRAPDIRRAKPQPKETDRQARYLSQGFVEKLCQPENQAELQREIEDVIFLNTPTASRAESTSFASFKSLRLGVVEEEKRRVTSAVASLSAEVDVLRGQVARDREVASQKKKVDDNIQKLTTEHELLARTLKDDAKATWALRWTSKLNETRAEFVARAATLESTKLKGAKLVQSVQHFQEDARSFERKTKETLAGLELDERILGEAARLEVVIHPPDLINRLETALAAVTSELELTNEKVARINTMTARLSRHIEQHKGVQTKLDELNKSLDSAKGSIAGLNRELQAIESARKGLTAKLAERRAAYISYFKSLAREKHEMASIYAPIVGRLKEEGGERAQFDFSVVLQVDMAEMARIGDSLIDHTVAGRFHRMDWTVLHDELKRNAPKLTFAAGRLGEDEEERLAAFVTYVYGLFAAGGEEPSPSVAEQLKSKSTLLDFDNWLYDVSRFRVGYSVKFQGIDLDKLSPGLKGAALLVLYLQLDDDDRPVLIDQPEENLDNRTVYTLLKDYFRQAKLGRQVVIVTHNPNLVVNTDAEQTIVANFENREPREQAARICYRSGALERTYPDTGTGPYLDRMGTREHICHVLEGGREAFENRESKYGFGRPARERTDDLP